MGKDQKKKKKQKQKQKQKLKKKIRKTDDVQESAPDENPLLNQEKTPKVGLMQGVMNRIPSFFVGSNER
jgi:hypothetical protein